MAEKDWSPSVGTVAGVVGAVWLVVAWVLGQTAGWAGVGDKRWETQLDAAPLGQGRSW